MEDRGSRVEDRSSGPEYWRTLEELAETDEFRELVEREFPRWADTWAGGMSRRRFLSLLGASLALAGAGCSQAPRERIMPYVRQPEGTVLGQPMLYATAMPHAGYATGGLLVVSREGRPIKVEGNPLHPGSPLPASAPEHAKFGPSDLYAQASLLTLYDPDRSRAVTHLNHIASWDRFAAALAAAVRNLPSGGAGLCILTETVTSPSLADQIGALLERYPEARWYVHEPVGRGNSSAGSRAAFGRAVEPRYRFDRANVVLSLDCDFLNDGPDHLRHTRDFMSRRKVTPAAPMNRLYAIEGMPTGTGAVADHRLPLRPSQVDSFARALAMRLSVAGAAAGSGPAHGVSDAWIGALAADLGRNRGRSIVLAGESQPPYVHALAHALNAALDNVGQTVEYGASAGARPPQSAASLADLVGRMRSGEVRLLLILGGNPVYSAPADLNFGEVLGRVGLAVHLGLYQDETAELCHWHVNEGHYLESWGDVRAADGTVSVVQPLIAPLYAGRTATEVLALLAGRGERSAYDILRAYWRRRGLPGGGDFERTWRRALHDGFIAGTAPVERVPVLPRWHEAPAGPAAGAQGSLEIVFKPDPALFDGRYANNGWLQEFPRPLSKLTWDNAAYLSPAEAVRLGLAPSTERAGEANGKELTLEYGGRRINAPAWVLPGHADGAVTVLLGGGRTRAGRVGTNVGYNAYALRTSAAPWFAAGLTVRPTGASRAMATTQHHHLMENREIIRDGTPECPPQISREANRPRITLTLYPERPQEGNQWGMAIDLSACSGCGSCIVACQAENNIPVVGKDQVLRGRELHWLRVDSYYKGDPENPKTFFQPVPCMHCENAPCEVVCPVMATVHSHDGLNDMVYNRCVGTRYCSNNCPYKVRRFNFFEYADFQTPSLQLGRNPEVTVRSRGVMEKCTYCVQRIRNTQIEARREDRPLRDGEIQTACQSACPAGAIVFGDLNAQSRVAELQAGPLNYGLLYDVNTRPRTTYLAALKNPNLDVPERWRA